MSVTLERLETLRDESMAKLDYHRALRDSYGVERTKTYRYRACFVTACIVSMVVVVAVGVPLMVLAFASLIVFVWLVTGIDLQRIKLKAKERDVEAQKALDVFVERIAHVEDRKLLMLMNPDAAQALEDEGQRNEEEDRRVKAKREEERAQAELERQKAYRRKRDSDFADQYFQRRIRNMNYNRWD